MISIFVWKEYRMARRGDIVAQSSSFSSRRSASPRRSSSYPPVPHSARTRKARSPRSECSRKKVKKVMGEYKRGTLRSSSGQKVKKRKQAVAIALSEARRACSPREISGGAKILNGLKKFYTYPES